MNLLRNLGVALGILAAWSAIMPSPARAQAQSQFIAIDLVEPIAAARAEGSEAPQLIGGSPLILAKGAVGGWFVRAMTLDQTGALMGRVVDVTFPPNPCTPPNPCKILYSKYLLPGQVLVLGDDGAMVEFPLTFMADGTPEAGSSLCHPPDPGMADLGPACAMTEMPGSAFGDGRPRLFVGTQSGMIAMLAIPMVGGGPALEGVIDLLAGMPIAALRPIPQMAGPVLGAAVGDEIVGIINPEILPAVQFTIINPDVTPIRDFVAQNPGPPTDPTYLAFCDGMNIKVSRMTAPMDASGSLVGVLVPPNPIIPTLTGPPAGLALGSMLILTDDGQGVYYDPGYDVLSGPSLCIADVNDPDPAVCVECPVTLTGDVNGTNSLTSADIISLVNFVFKSSVSLQPCEMAGDVNCDGKVTSADIIKLVNFVFKGGPPPCDVCTLWLDLWTSCP